jgi:glycosyltransferase involved in cell wall biosynthesis
LIYCPTSQGGIAEHANYQARALQRWAAASSQCGVGSVCEVFLLCGSDFLDGREVGCKKTEIFNFQFSFFGCLAGRLGKLLDRSLQILVDQWRLASEVMRRRPDFVLISSYSEYLSPLWIWPHWILARLFGVIYIANLHDPVRDFQVGPRWWHELSVKMAYWPISIGIVHQRLPEPTPVPAYVKVVEAPVGVYDLQESPENPAEIRAGWGIPDSGVVFLAFGYIRDNKNLDLVIRALAEFPQAHLIVMGKAQSQKDKPVEFYRKLADELDMSGRVKFFATFVPDEKLASYFAAADVVVLTYDKSFHSQSGVLNVAARARRPVLASAGESPLKDCVQKFRLGVFVEPDDMRALKEGIKKISSCQWRASSGEPDWQGYETFASWDVNVAKILDAVESIKISKRCNSETLRNQSCKK